MYYNSDKFEQFPDQRDPVTGDWLPLSESDKARIIRDEESAKMSDTQLTGLLSSIFK